MVQAPVVQRLDNTIHWIRLYLVDNAICFAITYLPFIQLGPGVRHSTGINWHTAITHSKDQEDKVSKIFLVIHHLIKWREKTSV